MHTLYRIALTAGAVFCYLAPPVWGLDNQKIIEFLEHTGDYTVAYPIVHQITVQTNDYRAWRNLADKYADFDLDGENYLHTWQVASKMNQVETFQDFMQIRPGTILNAHAIRAIYRLTCSNRDIDALLHFIEMFPDTVEAIEAVLIVQELAFNKAKSVDKPEFYDKFISYFPTAQQVPDAMELAFQAERRAVEAENAKLDADAHERLARKIFNDGRVTESAANNDKTMAPEHAEHVIPIASARKYRLLFELPIFRDTQSVTELADRQERTAYHRLELAQLEKINNGIKSMNEAIVDAVKLQIAATKAQGELIVLALQKQTGVIEKVGIDVTNTMNQNTATLTIAVNSVRAAVDNNTVAVTKAVNEVKAAVDNNTQVVSAAIDRVRAAVDNNTAVVSGAINNNTKVVSQAVQNVGQLFEVHNRILDQQLLMMTNPGAVIGGAVNANASGGDNGAGGAVANQITTSVASTACEYSGKFIGGAAGAVYGGGPVGGAVGYQVGGVASKFVCDKIGKVATKVKDAIVQITKPVAKIASKVGDFFKGWVSFNYNLLLERSSIC